MIFERREYVFRAGGARAFLAEQERWNTPDVFGAILDRNICYFETITGEDESIVHLYRFDSIAAWRAVYEAYYAKQSVEYFATVRPLMLRQENAIFEHAPLPQAGAPFALSSAALETVDPARALVVERIIDFHPGGLPPYWRALAEGSAQALRASDRLLGTLVSIVGRLHRVAWYHYHPDHAEFERHAQEIAEDPTAASLRQLCAATIAGRRMTLMRPVGLASRRTLFQSPSTLN